jgi:fructosamine-3-kinase
MDQQLADLHRTTAQDEHGLKKDNYLRTTAQINAHHANWNVFWRERRLIPQLDRFARAGNQGDRLVVMGWEPCDRLDEFIDVPDEPGILLHGGLWFGNAASDAAGQ